MSPCPSLFSLALWGGIGYVMYVCMDVHMHGYLYARTYAYMRYV